MQVREIVDAEVKSGVGAKGPWTQALVELEDGQQVRIFQPIKVGDNVESYETESNGTKYTNWRLVKSDPKHDEIMTALRKIYGAITGVETAPSGLEKARAESAKIKERVEAKTEKEKDEVFDVEDGEAIDLSSIPF